MMGTKKYFRFSVLLLLLGGLLMACVVEQGEERPRRTQGEYAVYQSLYVLNARAIKQLRIAAGFDAYLRQTSDEGRAVVVARFFPWAKIIVRTESGWRLHDGEIGSLNYHFMIKDDLLLGQPGASWLCYYSSDMAMMLACSLETEGDGIRCKGFPMEDSRVDWLIGMTLTDRDFQVTFAGESGFEYDSDRYDEDCWTVECRIDTPLLWSDRENGITDGVMLVAASLSGAVPRRINFTVEHLGNGVNIIAQDGVTEFWRWMD